MANLIFPAETTRTVMGVGGVGTPLTSVSGQTATIYLDSGGLTPATITAYPGGGAIVGSTLTIDTYGRLPFFFGPDTTTSVLYVKVGTGPVLPLLARCVGTDDPNVRTIFQGAVSGLSAAFVPLTGNNTFVGTQTVTQGGLNMDRSAEGSGVAPEQHLIAFNGWWITGGAIDIANAPFAKHAVPLAKGNSYNLNDAATTSGSTTLTSASEGGFAASQVGAPISGPGIPNGTTISAVVSATQITMSAPASVTATGVRVLVNKTGVTDQWFVRHGGGLPPTFGFGITPPDANTRLQIAAGHTDNVALGGVQIVKVAGFTGKSWKLTDSGNNDRLWFDKDDVLNGNNAVYNGALVVKGDATNGRPLMMLHQTSGSDTGFEWGDNTTLAVKCFTTGNRILDFWNDGSLRHVSTKLGFYSATPATKPTVTGSKGANAALTSLMSALSTLGLVTDTTT